MSNRGWRFPDFREIEARRAGAADCRPGHTVRPGEIIGYARKRGIGARVWCADCWARWTAENAAADADESFYAGLYGRGE